MIPAFGSTDYALGWSVLKAVGTGGPQSISGPPYSKGLQSVFDRVWRNPCWLVDMDKGLSVMGLAGSKVCPVDCGIGGRKDWGIRHAGSVELAVP